MKEKVLNLVNEPLKEIDVFVDNVEVITEHKNTFLRITIDSETQTVDLDKCVAATKIINPLIDQVDQDLDENYMLEVSSKEKGE